MDDSDDPTKWTTVVEEGDEIDESALNDWLESRGDKEKGIESNFIGRLHR